MIYAKTGVERMPEHCEKCRMCRGGQNTYHGAMCGVTSDDIDDQKRRVNCPLVEIDDTKEDTNARQDG